MYHGCSNQQLSERNGSMGQKGKFQQRKANQNNTHFNNLQTNIRSCGISFQIWEKTNADGKGSGMYDFTSLLGADKKKLLAELPDKLSNCIHPETSQTVIKIWKDFHELYKIITNKNPSIPTYLTCFDKAKAWINLFTSLRDKLLGYKKADVTPYMHALVYHVPLFMKKYKPVKPFTGQGVEKTMTWPEMLRSTRQTREILLLISYNWNFDNGSCARGNVPNGNIPRNTMLTGRKKSKRNEEKRV